MSIGIKRNTRIRIRRERGWWSTTRRRNLSSTSLEMTNQPTQARVIRKEIERRRGASRRSPTTTAMNLPRLCIFIDLLVNKHRVICTIKLHSIFYYLPYTWMEREQVTTHFVTPRRRRGASRRSSTTTTATSPLLPKRTTTTRIHLFGRLVPFLKRTALIPIEST